MNNWDFNHTINRKQFEATEFMLNKIIEIYKGLSQIHFRLTDLRPFLWHNYHAPEKGLFDIKLSYTGILDISSYGTLEKYLGSIRACRRQEYKKAKEGDIKIVDSHDVDKFIELYKKTFERQDFNIAEDKIYLTRSIITSALEKSYGRMQFAMVKETPLAAIVFLYDKKRGYYLYGANDPQYRLSGAGTRLLVENIWQCKEDGLAEVDFVGVNSPNRGDYKLSFGGELVPCFGTHLNLGQNDK
jgi:lipid II:glycine glycyltransferase (peptidoglycan interpeptide bridge formation enzyme)